MTSPFDQLLDEVPAPADGPQRARDEGRRRTRRRARLVVAGGVAVVVLAAVGLVALPRDGTKQVSTGPTATTPGSETELDGRQFVSTAVTEAGADTLLVLGRPIRIAFDGGEFRADPGCNQVGGRYSLEGSRLDVSEGSMTDMACGDPRLSEQDDWFVRLLGAGPTVVLSGDHLTLTSGDTVITFVDRRASGYDKPLVGTSWTLETTVDGQGATAVPNGVTATLDVTPTVVRWQACNAFGAPVTIADSTLALGDADSTVVGCAGDGQAVDDAMGAVLTGTVTYTIDGSVLTLTNGDHSLQFRAS